MGASFKLYDGPLIAKDLAAKEEPGSTHVLGDLVVVEDDTYGRQVFRRFKNGSGAALAAGEGVMIKSGQTDPYVASLGAANTANARMIGVVQGAVPDGYYGWALVSGKGLIKSNGSTTTHTAQKMVASGQFADGTIGTDELPVFALAANASAGTTGLGLVRLGGE